MKEFDLIISSFGSIALSLIVIPFLPVSKKSTGAFLLIALTAVLTSIPAVGALFGNTNLQHSFFLQYPFDNIPVRIDPLAAWFMLIINLTCINGAWYGIGYMKTYEVQKNNVSFHWICFIVFQASMLWVCVLQHGLAFLMAWEIMSISSLMLVIFEHRKPDTLKAGMNYLIQMHIGVVLLTIAFIWIYRTEGSFDFSAIDLFFSQHHSLWLFLILVVGFGIKAGLIPLHTWLPHAHSAAPSPVSGVMSGVIVQMGIYGILRMITYLHSSFLQIGGAILIVSLLTAFYGILNAAVQRDFKRMLAYSTVENIGIIGIAIGIGLIGKGTGNIFLILTGFGGALLHALNHSLYKSLLFFTAGNLYQQTHTRNMDHLGGLIKSMPVTAIFFLCGGLAISALPPFNGFVSEFIIYSGLLEGIKSGNIPFNLLMIVCIAILVLVGGISLLTFTQSFGTIFLGKARTPLEHKPNEISMAMQSPLFIILAFMILIAVFPNLLLATVVPVIQVFDATHHTREGMNMISPGLMLSGRVSLLLTGLVALIFYIRTRITQKRSKAFSLTWSCGYSGPNKRMQYTSKSFAKSLAKLFSFLTAEKKKYHEIDKTIFPSTRSYQSTYNDFFEIRLIDRVNKQLIGFMNNFTFIHNGQIQRYILYGLFFIISFIVATFLNLL